MKIISFLGFNQYIETTYVHPQGTDKCLTPFFQEALVQFYQPETLYVLLTHTVETKPPRNATEPNWTVLKRLLENRVQLKAIKNIPERNTPEDIWWMFQQIDNCLEPGDRVIFDITHSFRSVPILALIAVSYLRVVRQVIIEGLLYGAFEAKNPENNETPTFDLLPIVSLLDWTTATDQFIKTGNGESLASLLHSSNPQTEKLAASIDGISKGLQLLRPMDVMQEAAMLPDHIAEASPIVSQSVPPFTSLLARVEKDYGNFGLENPSDYINHPQASLLRQLKIIEWYAEKGQTVQALSLAREWLPSLLCYHFQLDSLDKKNREEMELLLTGGKVKDSEGNTIKESVYLEQWSTLPKKQKSQLNRLWVGDFNLANLRNDVLHAGFRKNPKPAQEILEKTKSIIEELKRVAQTWNLEDDSV
ncbi:MAG: TIGR02221 family CRISPR-associated protein [Planktothrix sp.]|uniref:TIGR02221 family CRISPR-associated protein n=1 Tax=Planktothrix sp. TaxID=3088171 RepID=UPI0038D4F3E7